MTSSTKIDEKFEGVENFWAWKYRVLLILEENDLEKFVKEGIAKPKGDEAKANFKKNMIREKRIIVDSIKDHLIPHVSSLDTPKEMFEALTRLVKWKIDKRYHAHVAEKEEPIRKKERTTYSEDEYISIATLTGCYTLIMSRGTYMA